MSRKLLAAGIAAVALTAVFCTGLICYATVRSASRAAGQRQVAHKREEESVRLMAKEESPSPAGDTQGSQARPSQDSQAHPGQDSQVQPSQDSQAHPGQGSQVQPGPGSQAHPGQGPGDRPGEQASAEAGETDAGEPAGTESKEGEPGAQQEEDKANLSLAVESHLAMYTYDQMVQDIEILQAKYPGLVSVDSLADTPDGRKMWHLIIGNRDAREHFLVTGSIHAREYMSTQLVMKQAAELLKNKDVYEEALETKAVHLVPMINPDGVSISQLGMEGCLKEETKAMVQEISRLDGATDMTSYLRRWKSNAQGIDLNRNFDAQWEAYNDGLGRPSADHYKGPSAECAPETAALVALTESYPFVRTISYHTQGSVIYWYFGQNGQLKEDTQAFAREISRVTGYPTEDDYTALDPAGYKDWAISKKGIPSLTIEVGRGASPVPADQFDTVWNENMGVWPALLGL